MKSTKRVSFEICGMGKQPIKPRSGDEFGLERAQVGQGVRTTELFSGKIGVEIAQENQTVRSIPG